MKLPCVVKPTRAMTFYDYSETERFTRQLHQFNTGELLLILCRAPGRRGHDIVDFVRQNGSYHRCAWTIDQDGLLADTVLVEEV